MTLARGIVFDMIRGALYVPRDAATVLALVRAAANGDFGPLAAQHLRTASMTTDSMTPGATFAVLCSEDLPAVSGRDFRRDAGDSLFGTAYADVWRSRCRGWPKGRPLAEPMDAVSQTPALILSGTHDPVTPPRTGEMMSRHFARFRHVVVPRRRTQRVLHRLRARAHRRFHRAGRRRHDRRKLCQLRPRGRRS